MLPKFRKFENPSSGCRQGAAFQVTSWLMLLTHPTFYFKFQVQAMSLSTQNKLKVWRTPSQSRAVGVSWASSSLWNFFFPFWIHTLRYLYASIKWTICDYIFTFGLELSLRLFHLFHFANLRLLFDRFLLKILEKEAIHHWFYLFV